MFSFGTKPAKSPAPAGRNKLHDTDASHDSQSFQDSAPPIRAVERNLWMDSAQELKQGLEVVEITDVPDDWFTPQQTQA